MKEPIFSGTCTALITPFQSDGSIDFARLGTLIERQIAAGIDAICFCGTTGESATLSMEEHEAIISFGVETVAGRCRVIAGTGSNDTKTALHLSLHGAMVGADALLLVTPYYNKTTQEGLLRHYTYVADRVNCPLILYNVPSRTGVSFQAKTYQKLSTHPNINGVKEASGNFSLIANTLALCGDDLHIWSGNDDHAIPMMAIGAKGLISVASNLIPNEMVAMTHDFMNGRSKQAASKQIEWIPLIAALFSEVNPIPIKTAMKFLELDSGFLRLPLCEMDSELRKGLIEEMKKSGILTKGNNTGYS